MKCPTYGENNNNKTPSFHLAESILGVILTDTGTVSKSILEAVRAFFLLSNTFIGLRKN